MSFVKVEIKVTEFSDGTRKTFRSILSIRKIVLSAFDVVEFER